VVPDRELNQLGGGLDIELTHHLVLMEGNGARRDVQRRRDLFHREAFGEQLQHFVLPRGAFATAVLHELLVNAWDEGEGDSD